MFAKADREPLRCPKCEKPLTPHEITLYSATDDSFFELASIGKGECSKCHHGWEIFDLFFLESNGSITVQRSN
jgi:hypothetical protein